MVLFVKIIKIKVQHWRLNRKLEASNKLKSLKHMIKIQSGIKNSKNIFFFNLMALQACYGESGLGQKYAFIKKSTIFTQSLRNLVKIRYSWVAYLPQVSQWLGKNCGFFNKSIFLAQSGFSVACLYNHRGKHIFFKTLCIST